MLSKPEIRAFIKFKKKEFNSDYFLRHSKLINIQLLNLFNTISQRCSDIVASFIPFDFEPDISDFNNHLLNAEFKLFVPKIIDSKIFELNRIFINQQFEKNSLGICEPQATDSLQKNSLDINKKIIIICPGLAFDCNGNRIGRGAGYYDNFFNEYGSSYFLKIGVAYKFAVLDNLPAAGSDVRMDYLVTPDYYISTNNAEFVTIQVAQKQ